MPPLRPHLMRRLLYDNPLANIKHNPDFPTEVIPLLLMVAGGLAMGLVTLYTTSTAPDVAFTKEQQHGWQDPTKVARHRKFMRHSPPEESERATIARRLSEELFTSTHHSELQH